MYQLKDDWLFSLPIEFLNSRSINILIFHLCETHDYFPSGENLKTNVIPGKSLLLCISVSISKDKPVAYFEANK